MEPKWFSIYLNKGIACALNNFGLKQYPFNSLSTEIIQYMVFIEYLYEGIALLLDLNF
jgi:hypothetical protein